MRLQAVVGLGVLAGVVASCTTQTEQPTAPLTRVSSSAFAKGGPGGGGSDPCADPKKEECILIGRFTGGGGQVVAVGGVYVTRGFTLHCDILLSNNLEINWPGNKWHTDKPFTAVECLDDPNYAPEPPAAPVDTYIGSGLGTLNGAPGYRAIIRFEDHGERPSSEPDRASIQIIAPDGVTVVLNVPIQDLTNGNIQAHFDQPHK